MSLPSWFTDTVTVIRPGTKTDRYGDTVVDWSETTQTDVAGCKVNPAAGTENSGQLDDRAGLTHRRVLAAPATADIRNTDRVQFQDKVFEVEGEVLTWRSPYGSVDHLYVQLVLVEG